MLDIDLFHFKYLEWQGCYMKNAIKVGFTIIARLYWVFTQGCQYIYMNNPSIVDQELGYSVLSISSQNGSTPHTILNFKL